MIYLFADGQWLLHRAWHASGKNSKYPEQRVPNLILDWFCAGAVRVQAKAGAIFFDGGKNFRKKLYPEYKANRNNTPVIIDTPYFNGKALEPTKENDLINQLIQPTMELFVKHGIVADQSPEFEADDKLISAAHVITRESDTDEVFLLARDKDMIQGVKKRVSLYTPAVGKMPERMLTYKNSLLLGKKMTPKQFLNFQILRGDEIDNIPPIDGITPAMATAIVMEFDKLSDFFATKVGKRIYEKNASELLRNRQMVTLVKTAWTKKDVRFQLTGTNSYAPALTALKSSLSKRSLF